MKIGRVLLIKYVRSVSTAIIVARRRLVAASKHAFSLAARGPRYGFSPVIRAFVGLVFALDVEPLPAPVAFRHFVFKAGLVAADALGNIENEAPSLQVLSGHNEVLYVGAGDAQRLAGLERSCTRNHLFFGSHRRMGRRVG